MSLRREGTVGRSGWVRGSDGAFFPSSLSSFFRREFDYRDRIGGGGSGAERGRICGAGRGGAGRGVEETAAMGPEPVAAVLPRCSGATLAPTRSPSRVLWPNPHVPSPVPHVPWPQPARVLAHSGPVRTSVPAVGGQRGTFGCVAPLWILPVTTARTPSLSPAILHTPPAHSPHSWPTLSQSWPFGRTCGQSEELCKP